MGMLCVERLKSVGDNTEPCGTPFVNLFMEVFFDLVVPLV